MGQEAKNRSGKTWHGLSQKERDEVKEVLDIVYRNRAIRANIDRLYRERVLVRDIGRASSEALPREAGPDREISNELHVESDGTVYDGTDP